MKKQFEYLILFILTLTFTLIWHYACFKSGFDLMPGDDGDAFLNILAADSWSDVFRGEMPIRQNRIFYPFEYGRGSTDLSLPLCLLAAPWQYVFGINIFHSALIVYGLLLFAGVFGMFYLLRNVLHLNFIPALGGALLTIFCNACYSKLIHTQFFFAYLLPLPAICVIRYCQNWQTNNKKKRVVYGMTATLTFAVIAYSNYYTAFFFALGAGIYFLIYSIMLIKKDKFKELLIPARTWELLLLAGWGALLFAPFIYIYMPLVASGNTHNWTAAQGLNPVITDIINIGPQNLLWGKLYASAFPPIHKYVYEHYYGLPPITLTAGVICLWYFIKKRKNINPAYTVLAAAIFVMYLVSLKFMHKVSLWYFIWKFIPGGSAIRATGRIYVFLMFPFMIFLWWMIDKLTRDLPSAKRIAISLIVLVLLVADNYNTTELYAWSSSKITARMNDIPKPPEDMQCFYIIDSGDSISKSNSWCSSGLLAWQMARHFKTFTINGYSGVTPADLTTLDPFAPDYRQIIHKWIRKHNLKNVYSYDVTCRKWEKCGYAKSQKEDNQ